MVNKTLTIQSDRINKIIEKAREKAAETRVKSQLGLIEPPRPKTPGQMLKARQRSDKERKALEEYNHPIRTKVENGVSNIVNKIGSALNKKLANRTLIKNGPQASVRTQEIDYNLIKKMDRDKSRFFKKTWEEEKRQLFFN